MATTPDLQLERGMPASLDAERSILGAILLDNLAYNEAAESLKADEFSLDGAHKADDLIGKAAHHSRVFMPTFEQKFAKHRAAPYHPIHTWN